MASEHTDGRYYSRDGLVYKAPVQHDEPDGSTSFSLGFPVCKMSEYVGEDAAETVALLMNQGEQATHLRDVNAALVEAVRQFLRITDEPNGDDVCQMLEYGEAVEAMRAALSSATGEQA